jgi:CheY-specific phosphatase CheX
MSIDVSLLNPFIDAVRRFFDERLGMPVTVSKPQLRPAGAPAQRAFAVSMLVEVAGQCSGRVLICLSAAAARAWIEGLRAEPFKSFDQQCVQALMAAGSEIVGFAAPQLAAGGVTLRRPRLVRSDNAESPPHSGLILTVDSPAGRLLIEFAVEAVAPSSESRAAA